MKNLNDIKSSELAVFLDVTPSFICSAKHGRRKFTVTQSQKINIEYGVSLTELRPDVYPSHIFNVEQSA